MSRQPRVWYPGATYHVHARGNRREAIFREQHDYRQYLTILEEVRVNHPFVLHSYCLMTNHLHLQIETKTSPISHIMKDLHFRYAVFFNRKYKFDGHLFQSRFGSKVIESIDYFLTVSRYIHRNPLEANIVEAMEDYRWSSYAAYLHIRKDPHIDCAKTYSYFNEPVHDEYRRYVESEG